MPSRAVAGSPGSVGGVLLIAAQVFFFVARGIQATGQREGVGAVLIDACFGDATAQRCPSGPFAYQGDLAHGDKIADRQFPGRFSRVAPAREYDLESDTAARPPPLDDSFDELRGEPGEAFADLVSGPDWVTV
jgi:hypothetical protein